MILAGLIGGPVVGFGAGLIAGGHRFLMDVDGFSSLPCGLGTLLEGTAAGLVSMRMKNRALNWRVAVVLGVVGESIHMGLVLALAQPFETALSVVRLIGTPMIILNAIGAGCLIEMIRMVVRNRERRASIQARKAMTIANQTVIHLREGLNEASALATAEIIHQQTRVAAVAVTVGRSYALLSVAMRPCPGALANSSELSRSWTSISTVTPRAVHGWLMCSRRPGST